MPPGIARLPRDKVRGYPVFYTIDHPERPDGFFLAQHPLKVLTCHYERRCNLCGQKLAASAWFIGGPNSTVAGQYVEAPIHEECLRYALLVCPFLLHKKVDYRETQPGYMITHTAPKTDTQYLVRSTAWTLQLVGPQAIPTFFLGNRAELVRWETPL